jgi:hypothetical protein
VRCSTNLSTFDLETEVFLHLLRNCLEYVQVELLCGMASVNEAGLHGSWFSVAHALRLLPCNSIASQASGLALQLACALWDHSDGVALQGDETLGGGPQEAAARATLGHGDGMRCVVSMLSLDIYRVRGLPARRGVQRGSKYKNNGGRRGLPAVP